MPAYISLATGEGDDVPHFPEADFGPVSLRVHPGHNFRVVIRSESRNRPARDCYGGYVHLRARGQTL